MGSIAIAVLASVLAGEKIDYSKSYCSVKRNFDHYAV